MVDLNKQKSLFFMELFLYLIFLDLDKMDIYRDKTTGPPSHFLKSQLLRLILEKHSLFRLSKVDLWNCIL